MDTGVGEDVEDADVDAFVEDVVDALGILLLLVVVAAADALSACTIPATMEWPASAGCEEG